MKPLKEVIGDILNYYIDDWDKIFKEINSEGRPDPKEIKEILLELCKRVERLESKE